MWMLMRDTGGGYESLHCHLGMGLATRDKYKHHQYCMKLLAGRCEQLIDPPKLAEYYNFQVTSNK